MMRSFQRRENEAATTRKRCKRRRRNHQNTESIRLRRSQLVRLFTNRPVEHAKV